MSDRSIIDLSNVAQTRSLANVWRLGACAALCATLMFAVALPARAEVDEEQLGAWYMYFFNTKFNDSLGGSG